MMIKKKSTKKSSKTNLKPVKPIENIYEKAFKQVDREESGSISLLLLDKLLIAANENISVQEIDDALDYMGKDREEDAFTLEEFKNFIKVVDCPDRVIEAFKTIDKDKNGYLDKDELFIIMSNFGGNLSQNEMDEIYNKVDVNHDGKIDYKEFVDYWYSK